MRPLITVDPGKGGAIVWGKTLQDINFCNMPQTEMDAINLFEDIADQLEHPEVWCEQITGFMAGLAGVSPKAMFTFGRQYERVRMAALANLLTLREITPTKWMKAAGIPLGQKKMLGATQWKNYLKQQCQLRFPEISGKITLKNADALLIYYALQNPN